MSEEIKGEMKQVRPQDVLVLANMAYRMGPIDGVIKDMPPGPMKEIMLSFKSFQDTSIRIIDEDLAHREMTKKDLGMEE